MARKRSSRKALLGAAAALAVSAGLVVGTPAQAEAATYWWITSISCSSTAAPYVYLSSTGKNTVYHQHRLNSQSPFRNYTFVNSGYVYRVSSPGYRSEQGSGVSGDLSADPSRFCDN